MQQIRALCSQTPDGVQQASPVTFTIHHLAAVNNLFMVVVLAMATGLRQLLSALQVVCPATVSEQSVLFITTCTAFMGLYTINSISDYKINVILHNIV